MPVSEGLMEMGDWSVTLRKDTPLELREKLWRWWSHVVITPAWVDPTQLSDAAVRAAARYSGVALRVGPQRHLGGYGMIWWLGDPRGVYRGGTFTFTSATYASVYETIIDTRLLSGSFPAGGSYTSGPTDGGKRSQLDRVTRELGHEWRVNADFTFDAGTVADLYGADPSVVLVDGAGGQDADLRGIDASAVVEGPDYERWYRRIYVISRGGVGDHIGTVDAVSRLPTGDAAVNFTGIEFAYLDMPDVTPGIEDAVAEALGPRYNQPHYQLSVDVRDEALVEHVGCGDLIWVYDEVEGIRDLDNQVEYGGRAIWPKLMRVTRMSWPVRQGMGVYWREQPEDTGVVAYHDLTPYVEWETGEPTLELIEGDPKKFYLNPDPYASRIDPVAAAHDAVRASPWDTYTPAWGSTGTAPSLGNGTIAGSYRKEGTTLHFGGQLTYGSTSTAGTGAWTVSLPAGLTAVSGRRQSCSATVRDVGSALAFASTGDIAASGTAFVFSSDRHSSTSGFFISDGVPVTWADGDTLSWSGTIELTP